jgi:hypothetical protein
LRLQFCRKERASLSYFICQGPKRVDGLTTSCWEPVTLTIPNCTIFCFPPWKDRLALMLKPVTLKQNWKLPASGHVCNPSYLGSWVQPRQKSSWGPILTKKKKESWMCTCRSSYGEKLKLGDCNPRWLGQKVKPYLKNCQSQKGWWCASSHRVPA